MQSERSYKPGRGGPKKTEESWEEFREEMKRIAKIIRSKRGTMTEIG